MAALTMTPSRQPFASLDSPRMRPVMRSKLNRQNQLNGAALSAKSSIFVDDAENIDPTTLSLSSKRKRSWDDEDDVSKGSPKPLKTSRLALTTRDHLTPRQSTPFKNGPSISTPKSAPILKPAGRSPPPKSYKTPGRRSTIAKVRPEATKRGVARPFSLAAALSQGKTKTPSTPKPQSKAPASWFFDIHVDSEQEEMTNLMQHSTGVLDISDDEGKAVITDGRGKENVPPSELGLDLPRSQQATPLATATAARKEFKMEEDRAPLGELTASDYYPENCNAFSFAVVHDDEDENVSESKKAFSAPPSQATFMPPAITASIDSLLATAMSSPTTKSTTTERTSDPDAIEIWETSSAADDAQSSETSASS
ncbi:hypothetical protein N7481_008232 [Penicillium waksmanii]|uniref:uncharacterized protein n=1 Tax=Penicillium waksmanii TaxID=69791 RepID=UPI002548B081|nr:uncharacterized protein N7481_008232 [Penicillium waksmanii]KAJ5980934.1 hypothetical protein N7481_008232 [Penicillium waksmanii]